MHLNFMEAKDGILKSFAKIEPICDSGLGEKEIRAKIAKIETAYPSRSIAKARTFELILTKAAISIDPCDIFQEKICGFGIMTEQRRWWEALVKEVYLAKESADIDVAWRLCGAYDAHGDYGHTSPNSRLLLKEGFSGLLLRVEGAEQKSGLTDSQKEFYLSCKIVLRAMMTAAKRLADAIAPYNSANAEALRSIAVGTPKNIYEAMQLLIFYFFMHEYIGGTRVRTLGRLDVLLAPFYKHDIESGRFTKAEIKELLKYFLYKFWAAKVAYDLPFCLSGMDTKGDDVTSEISYLIVDTYDELNIHSPKIHIRVCDKTPKGFIKKVLDCIRRGNSSFVFVNDRIGIESLMRVGIAEREARDYVPIGCYEPAVWGVELGCTGNGGVNLPKAIELVFNAGRDLESGILCGVPMKLPTTYESFVEAVKLQIKYMTEKAADYITKIEGHYRDIHPDALLSSQYNYSIECGKDVYEGGAKYNNSSLYFYSIATLIDSLCAVKKLVFIDKRFTLSELRDILISDWHGYERERQIARHLSMKYGNGEPISDALTKDFASFCASLINNKPNGRGGVFKAALFTIDFCFAAGKKTMATPDGRRAGEPLSKNLCASVGMDRKGITALINSVTNIDFADFPTGSVLDIVLHPTAVSGEDGLEAFYSVLSTYFKKGGFAMHGNIFDAEILKLAQAEPEKYKNLQVRVCGWNAYFVNLSKTEQDSFIRQAEARV